MTNRGLNIAMVAACPFPYPRGTPTRVFRVAEALVSRGHWVHVITYHLGQEDEQLPFKIHRTPEIKSYQNCSPGPTYQKLLLLDPLLTFKLWQVLQNHPIDVIHAHHYEGLLVAAAVQKWTNHPVIYDAHTLLQSELPFYELGLSQRIKKSLGIWLDRQLPKLADHTISVTPEIKQKLILDANIAPEKITVVSNGVEHDHFGSQFSGQSSIPGEKKVLIFTGNLAAYQGIELMLQAFRKVLDQQPDTSLRIVTNDSFAPYQALAHKLKIGDNIEIVPSDYQNLPQQLATAAIALNPRVDCDGIPLKLLNYMAAGKAIVSFAGSAKAIEAHRTGLVVDDGDTTAFARAITSLLTDPVLLRRLGQNAREEARARYTWEIMARQVEKVYEAVRLIRHARPLSSMNGRYARPFYGRVKAFLNHFSATRLKFSRD